MRYTKERTFSGQPAARNAGATLPRRKTGRPDIKARVLAMDDDPIVRSIIRDALKDSGYDVRVTKDGSEALKQFIAARDADKPFDAVILDLVVPSGMPGDVAVREIRRIEPGIKVILLTGMIEHPALPSYESLGFDTTLIKPFLGSELVYILQRVLGGQTDETE